MVLTQIFSRDLRLLRLLINNFLGFFELDSLLRLSVALRSCFSVVKCGYVGRGYFE